jgi:hypothetical protein
LTALTIPDSVTTIGSGAFSSNKLTSLTLGNAVTTLGDYAFYGNPLTTLTIPDSVTTIGGSAFADNELTAVTIGNGVTAIRDQAFLNNPLTTLTLGNAVTLIGEGAFMYTHLVAVSIPASVTTIHPFAFYGDNLTTVFMEGDAPTNITSAGFFGSFGRADGHTVYFTAEHGGSFSSPWNGYTALQARWAKFDSNGHGLNPVAEILGSSETASAPADPGAGEFAFQGWYTAAVGGTLWDFTTPVTGFINLYAQWGLPFDTVPSVTIGGVAKVGEQLTADAGTWDPAPSLSYAWKHEGSATVLGTGDTYIPTATDLDHSLTVTVTAVADGYQTQTVTSTSTAAVVAGTFTVTPAPLIGGVKKVGRTLRAFPGWWEEDVALSYAWKQVGVNTTLSTASRYIPVAADIGKALTVTVTATLAGYTTASVTSVPTIAIGAGQFLRAPVPTITGTTQVGSTLTAVTGTWTAGASFTYVWKRGGSNTTLSTNARYTAVSADMGKTLTVTVTATRSGFTTASRTSLRTSSVSGLPFTSAPEPTITGSAISGSLLTARTSGWAPSSSVTFTYVWKRASTADGVAVAISGANASTYRLGTADKGKWISVTVVASRSGMASTTRTSAPTRVAS